MYAEPVSLFWVWVVNAGLPPVSLACVPNEVVEVAQVYGAVAPAIEAHDVELIKYLEIYGDGENG